jgi:CRISPR-associated protein Cmr4
MEYQTHIFRIKALTNVHVGSGESDFTYVDKQVQRDPISLIPVIHASGMKGALREYFGEGLNWAKAKQAEVNHIFGSPTSANTNPQDMKQGHYRFFSAELVAIPIPHDTAPYFERVHDDSVLAALVEKIKNMGKTITPTEISDTSTHNNTAFKNHTDELPVIARNHLENGRAQNLWYEEVVPRESLFVWIVQAPKNDAYFEAFKNAIHRSVIQIGANATVGYGYCCFTHIA